MGRMYSKTDLPQIGELREVYSGNAVLVLFDGYRQVGSEFDAVSSALPGRISNRQAVCTGQQFTGFVKSLMTRELP